MFENIDEMVKLMDCCFRSLDRYFIMPTGHGLKPLDVALMKRVHHLVNLIPVIAKSDGLTLSEREAFKARVHACTYMWDGFFLCPVSLITQKNTYMRDGFFPCPVSLITQKNTYMWDGFFPCPVSLITQKNSRMSRKCVLHSP